MSPGDGSGPHNTVAYSSGNAKMMAEKEENKKLKLAEHSGGELKEHNMLAASWVNDINN